MPIAAHDPRTLRSVRAPTLALGRVDAADTSCATPPSRGATGAEPATAVRAPATAMAILALALAGGAGPAAALTQSPTTGGDEWYLRAGDCRLYVTEAGEGPPVVVLHGGWGAEHSYLIDAFDGLRDDHRLVFYDQRGSLRSPCPDSTISVERHVADLERLRDELGLARMRIVAHSMGTILAMAYLQAHPDLVDGLVLVGALTPRPPQGAEEDSIHRAQQRAFAAWTERPEVARVLEAEGLSGDSLSDRQATHRWRISFAAGNVVRVDRWRRVKGGQVFYDQGAGTAAARTMGRYDYTAALRDADFPITVIVGDHDLTGFGGELHRRIYGAIEPVRLVLIPDAGHNPWIDRPDLFREELRRALARR